MADVCCRKFWDCNKMLAGMEGVLGIKYSFLYDA